MLVQQKSGNIYSFPTGNFVIDKLPVEWYEANKRILHKQTNAGVAVTLKFLNANPNLEEGDILWQDGNKIIAVEIITCQCIVLISRNMMEASSISYEIGNRHLPLFYEGDELLVPYEDPLYNLLQAAGYQLKIEERKLNTCFRTTVLPHVQVAGADSLFSKINKLSTSL